MKKRKLNHKARGAVGLFGGLVLTIMAGFGVTVHYAMQNQPASYPMTQSCVAYDTSARLIPMTATGTASKSWSGEWKLSLEDGSTYDLGTSSVLYDAGVLRVLGGGYQILEENNVQRLSSYTEISNLSTTAFYKLADRRYLVVAPEIRDTGNLVDTANYLYIVMDKAGNALLLNDTMCVKTINATVLDMGDCTFDIANEILTMGMQDIDCKKIIGTTNEYDPDSDVTLLRQKAAEKAAKGQTNNPEEVVLDLSGGDGGTGGTGGNGGLGGNGGTGGNGGDGGLGGIGGIGGTGGTGGTGGSGGNGGKGGTGGTGGSGGQGGTGVAPDVADGRRTMNMYGITAGYNSLTITYSVNDPYGQLGDVYFRITDVMADDSDGDKVKRISADIDGTQATIYNLKANTYYKVEFCNGLTDTAQDTQYVTTASLSADLVVTGITENSVSYTVRFHSGLAFSEGSVTLTDGGSLQMTSAINVTEAAGGGYSGVFTGVDLGSKGSSLTLRLSDMKYGSQVQNVATSVSIGNPYVGKSEWQTFLNSHGGVMNFTYTADGDTVTGTNAQPTDLTSIENAIKAYDGLSQQAKAWAPELGARLEKIRDYLSANAGNP